MKFNEMFDIKESEKELPQKKEEMDVGKNIMIRLGVLIGAIILFFVVLSIMDKHSGALGALYLSMYFYGIWLIYMVLETVVWYVLKKNEQGTANLIVIIILVLLSALTLYNFA
ncbi:hypothetical protein ABEG63_07380 [Chryseobacterium sp. C39-AII1]|uniref:hypothetical protein n=1 Tax=Chryseobacterium sp. C39-AII1 TaxID=3080332 RepID=UPI00320AC1C5